MLEVLRLLTDSRYPSWSPATLTRDTPETTNANLDKSHPLRDMVEIQIEEVYDIDQHWEGLDEWVGE